MCVCVRVGYESSTKPTSNVLFFFFTPPGEILICLSSTRSTFTPPRAAHKLPPGTLFFGRALSCLEIIHYNVSLEHLHSSSDVPTVSNQTKPNRTHLGQGKENLGRIGFIKCTTKAPSLHNLYSLTPDRDRHVGTGTACLHLTILSETCLPGPPDVCSLRRLSFGGGGGGYSVLLIVCKP